MRPPLDTSLSPASRECCTCSSTPPAPGTIEYAVAEDRLTEEGELWAPDAEDVTLQVCARGGRAK